MSQAQPEERSREAELRDRIAAGAAEVADYQELANLLNSDARDDEAIRVYERTLTLPLTGMQRASVLWELGALVEATRAERERARALAEEALEVLSRESNSPEARLLRGLSLSLLAHAMWFQNAHAASGIAQQGLQVLERLIEENAGIEAVGTACYEAARLLNALNRPEKAITFCQQYLRQSLPIRDRVGVLIVLADALRLAGRFVDAEQAAAEALRSAEAHNFPLPYVYLSLGSVQCAAGRRSEARTTFELALRELNRHEILRKDRESLTAIYGNLAEIYYDSGDFERAAEAFERLLALHPEDRMARHRILVWLGDCHMAIGQRGEARRYYEEVVMSREAADEERQHARDGLATLGQ